MRDSADVRNLISEPADNRMLKADCHHRIDTFDTGLNPSSPVLPVTRIFKQLPEAQNWHEHCVSIVERFNPRDSRQEPSDAK
jgi:hypothetical protein